VSRSLPAVAAASLPPVVWFVVHGAGLVATPVPTACLSGFAIFGAAFLLSWATEAAQIDVPGPLAVAFLALVAVLPEYAVDVYFAWEAGRDPAYTAFATANMTGANRLLIGVGWAVPVFAVWLRQGATEVVLPRDQAVEVNYLALATLYSFVIPLKGTLGLVDTVVLLLIFFGYMLRAAGARHEEPELEGPSAMIASLRPAARRAAVLGIFALAGAAIFTAAEPFAESLVGIGEEFGIEKFLLVQWLAPLASESPEFIVATLFALRGAAAAGMGTMISSKVNQWTLLVGALPAAFALSHGGLGSMVLDSRQREEIFLTSAQSLLALVVIANFRFSLGEALVLFGLFVPQFLFTSQSARLVLAAAYLVLSAGAVAASPDTRRGVLVLLPGTHRLRGSRGAPDG
jgi:cation:H+ antiporter